MRCIFDEADISCPETYCFTLEDLHQALRNLKESDPTVHDFGKYWFYPIWQLSDSFDLDQSRGFEMDDEEDQDLSGISDEFPGLLLSDGDYFQSLWWEMENTWEDQYDENHLSEVWNFDEMLADFDRFLANRGKPVEERQFSLYDFLSHPDIVIGIGSDWSPSGSKTVWDECKFAYNFAPLNIEDLLRACILTPARMIKNDKVGNIQKGRFTDFFILKGMDQADITSAPDLFITAGDSSVEGVVVGGIGIYGEKDLLESLSRGVYSQYAETPAALGSKYFRIPDIFGGPHYRSFHRTITPSFRKRMPAGSARVKMICICRKWRS